jgi:hypothetical protein
VPSTYELLVDSSRILGSIEAEQGVLTPECELALASWLESSEDKLHSCLALSRRLDSEATLLKEEEARLKARRQAMESAEERVKMYATALLVAREELGEEPKVKTSSYTAWLAETQSVSGPEDVSEWPEMWRRVKTEPDRAAALKAAKAGAELPAGFRLESKRGVRWR